MKKTNQKENGMFTFYAFRRIGILSLAMLSFGCSSGGSSGDDATVTTQTVVTEIDTNTLIIDQPALTWTNCENQFALECASLLVPLDYSDPDGESISLAMARRPADQATLARTVIMNPGGPGGDGINFLDSLLRLGDISTSMTDAFNFVSFDPRGIGASNSVDCDMTDLFALNEYPTNRAAIESNVDKLVSFAQSCVASDGDYIQHLGSFNVVRDINEMRKALELPQIDFLGYSYGTRLAALYMQTYPQHTGRFVLDGSMKPEPEVALLALGSLSPGQANINTLANACIGIPVLCLPGQFATDLQNRLNELSAAPLSQEASLLLLILRVASTQPGFEQFLIGGLSRYLQTLNVDELTRLDTALGLTESLESDARPNITAFFSVMCADDSTRPSLDSLDTLLNEFNAVSDLLAETQMFLASMCVGWPESIDPIPQIATNQAPVSLIIGGPSDAQTPLVYAQEMAQAVGGQFLRSEHSGHVTAFTGKNSCTDAAIETFFLTGNLPTSSVCEANVDANATSTDWRKKMTAF